MKAARQRSLSSPARLSRREALLRWSLAAVLAPWALGARAQTPKTAWLLDRASNAPLPNSTAAQAAVDKFAAAYVRAGRPRIALLWNRELTDRVNQDQRDVARLSGQANRDGSSFSVEASRGTVTDREAQRTTTLSERDLWLVETEFSRRLLDAGTQLIDRAAIMRLTGASSPGTNNVQLIEMNALLGKADLFLEILLTRDASAPLGWGFRSNCKDVKTGRVLGTQYLTAMPELPPRAAPRYQVSGTNYVLVESEAPSLSLRAIGEALAVEAMTELTRRLSPTP